MCWKTYKARRFKFGMVDKLAELQAYFNWTKREPETDEIICSSYLCRPKMVGSTLYGAIEFYSKETGLIRYGVVVLTRQRSHCYLDINVIKEDEGPKMYKCPKNILDILTPTTNEYALEWRNKCREQFA